MLLVLVGLLSACTDTRSDLAPEPDGSAAAREGTWTGLGAPCPTLDSPAANALGIAGTGTATAASAGPYPIADCRWGATDGKGMSATARISVYPARPAAAAAWEVLTTGATGKLPDVGDEAVVSPEPAGVRVLVRSRNVVAIVRILLPEEVPAGESATRRRLDEVTPVAGEIARDILDDLR